MGAKIPDRKAGCPRRKFMENQDISAIRMNETDYSDVISERCGLFQMSELQKLLSDCKAKGIPFLLTDERGKITKRIV